LQYVLLIRGPLIESAMVQPTERIPRVKWSYVAPDKETHTKTSD